MKKRMKQLAALAAVGVMVFSLAACGGNNAGGGNAGGDAGSNGAPAAADKGGGSSASGDTIKIGSVVPMTGALAAFGHGTQEMTDYAVKQVNDAGGIEIDGEAKQIEMVYVDSESDPQKAQEATTKLIEGDGVQLVITSHTNDTTIPVAGACERKGIPCLSVDTPTDAWAAECGENEYSFHAGFNTENELNCFKDAWDKVADSNKKIGLMYASDVEGQELSGAITTFAQEAGYTIVDPGSYTSGDNDFSSIINKIKGEECDIICGVMVTPDFATFYTQLKSSGYMPKVVTVAKATLFSADVDAVGANGAGDGVVSEVWWTPNHPYSSSISGQTSQEIGDAWMEITGDDYAPATAGYDYANVEIVYQVLKAAGSLDPDAIKEAAEGISFDSVIGPIKYNEQHTSIQPLVTGQWCYQDGGWVQEIISNTQVPEAPVTAELKELK
ncbi:MAG: ABC transporter substrate-binding protein [Eubacterium sp.]|nr:ABC transporter substrate-binding protein [Eubacterium sp.]